MLLDKIWSCYFVYLLQENIEKKKNIYTLENYFLLYFFDCY